MNDFRKYALTQWKPYIMEIARGCDVANGYEHNCMYDYDGDGTKTKRVFVDG